MVMPLILIQIMENQEKKHLLEKDWPGLVILLENTFAVFEVYPFEKF